MTEQQASSEALFLALRKMDDEWYPMLAGTAIGHEELGNTETAKRWSTFCRQWRGLIDGERDRLTRVEEAVCRIVDECSHREALPEPCPVCLAEIALFGSSDGAHD